MRSTKRKKMREGIGVFTSAMKHYLVTIVSPLVFAGMIMVLMTKLRLIK